MSYMEEYTVNSVNKTLRVLYACVKANNPKHKDAVDWCKEQINLHAHMNERQWLAKVRNSQEYPQVANIYGAVQ